MEILGAVVLWQVLICAGALWFAGVAVLSKSTVSELKRLRLISAVLALASTFGLAGWLLLSLPSTAMDIALCYGMFVVTWLCASVILVLTRSGVSNPSFQRTASPPLN
jgi:hypothetical protein